MKIQKKKFFFFFLGGGGGGVRGRVRGVQGGCERRIKFLWKIHKKMGGGIGREGGQVVGSD